MSDMTTHSDVYDSDGANVTASLNLNDHHKAIPSNPEGDGACTVCGFAAGWVQMTPISDEERGHSTTATYDQVAAWILAWDMAAR